MRPHLTRLAAGLIVTIPALCVTACGGGTSTDPATTEPDAQTTRTETADNAAADVSTINTDAAADINDALRYTAEHLVPLSLIEANAGALAFGRDPVLSYITPAGDCFGMMGAVGTVLDTFHMVAPHLTLEREHGPRDNANPIAVPRRHARAGAFAWHVCPDGVGRQLGLTDALHTGPNGIRFAQILDVNDQGKAYGISWRYPEPQEETPKPSGHTVWVYDGQSTHAAGLINTDQHFNATPTAMNTHGDLTGYTASSHGGSAAWVYRNGETQRIGLEGENYTRHNGEHLSRPMAINNLGHVVGWTRYYDPESSASNNGCHAWYFNGEETVRLHTPLDEELRYRGKFRPLAINDAGQVLLAINTGKMEHQTAIWLIDGEDATKLGIVRGMMTQDYDRLPSGAGFASLLIEPTGCAAGSSHAEEPAWVYDGEAVHRFDRSQFPEDCQSRFGLRITKLFDTGVVTGEPDDRNFVGSDRNAGDGAWLWDGSALHILHLDDEQAPGQGGRVSHVVSANANAMAAGYTRRQQRGTYAAWHFDGNALRRIGLTDDLHTWSPSNFDIDTGNPRDAITIQESAVITMNAHGQTLGQSRRAVNAFERNERDTGQTPWLFDPATGQTHIVVQPERDGQRYPSYTLLNLTDQGVVLGRIDGSWHTGGQGFLWSADAGTYLLNPDHVTNMRDTEWDRLHTPLHRMENGTVIGIGSLTPRQAERLELGRRVLFRLTPVRED